MKRVDVHRLGEEDAGSATAAATVARTLREEIILLPPASFLGSEDALISRLGTSRATFRQAARILEHQGLLVIRRGPQGGYYSRLPHFRQVVDAAVLYLRTQGTSLEETTAAAHALTEQISRDAALSTKAEKRAELREVMDYLKGVTPEDMSTQQFVRDELLLTDAIFGLVGKPSLHLVMKIFYHFALDEFHGALFERRPDRRRAYRDIHLELAEAIFDGNADRAASLTREMNAMSEQWARAGGKI